MEIREHTVSFEERKARAAFKREPKFPSDWKNLIIKYVAVIIYQT